MDRPKLRKVERIAHQRGEESLVIIRDPLGLSEPFALDADLAPLLDLLDGTRTISQIRQSLLMTHQLDVATEEIAAFAEQLHEQGLLDDAGFVERWADLHQDFIEAEHRPPRLAGLVYPDDADALAAALGGPPALAGPDDPVVRGVLAPHGPFGHTARLLAETLAGLPPAAALQAIVVLGTDHGPGLLPYAVTPKRFDTPLGEVPVATPIIDALRRRVPWIEREQIRHRDAISMELAAVTIRWLYGDRCPPIVPVLCGATAIGVAEQAEACERFEASLGALCEDRPILWWVSAELSHAGPAYGRPAVTEDHRMELQQRDADLLTGLRRGNEAALLRTLAAEHPQGPASGGPALVAATRMLPAGYRGELVRQSSYPAPGDTPGLVGIGGVRLY